MITKIKTKDLKHLTRDIKLEKIKKHNIIIAPNGWGKTQLIKAIRDKLFQDCSRCDIKLDFSNEFKKEPKGVYFSINEELDSRAIRESVNLFDGDTYCSRLVESVTKSELSNGQDQQRTLKLFSEEVIKEGFIWFLDEPEKSLDIVELSELINNILKLNAQIFIITHSPLFIMNDKFNKIILDENYYEKAISIIKKEYKL